MCSKDKTRKAVPFSSRVRHRAAIHKASVGCRLREEAWGEGIASEALRLITEELVERRGIEIIIASTMIENHTPEQVLMNNGFTLVKHAVNEDWVYPEPTLVDKWIL